MAIGITGMGSISALGGGDAGQKWKQANRGKHFLCLDSNWSGRLSEALEALLEPYQKAYQRADRTVHLALHAASAAVEMAQWEKGDAYGINLGSSRGATGLWEDFHSQHLKDRRLHPTSSPTTTLGGVSSWVGQHFRNQGPVFSHSITCSTALHAVLNACAWIESGRCDRFLAGGTEAPLTPFTFGQMNALRLCARPAFKEFPCRALDLEKKENTMVLGEGAAIFCLEKDPDNPLAWLAGLGFGTEETPSPSGISPDGKCLRDSMEMALRDSGNPQIDVVVTHSPGTVRGDAAEKAALDQVFGKEMPRTNNKWMIGHTLGASGGLSLEWGILMLQHQQLIGIPYLTPVRQTGPIRHILINAVGFGGNAVSLIIRQAI